MKIKIIIILLSIILLVIIGGCMLGFFKKEIEIKNIKSLYFQSITNMSINGNTEYEIKCNEKCIATIKPYNTPEEEKQEIELSKETMNELEEMLNKYHVGKWDGFHKVNKKVLDGHSFTLSITLENEKEISAHGYMKYPNHYNEVKEELKNILEKYYKSVDK